MVGSLVQLLELGIYRVSTADILLTLGESRPNGLPLDSAINYCLPFTI
jgi:hypothetical protein